MTFENETLKESFVEHLANLYQELIDIKAFVEDRGYTLSNSEENFCNDAETLVDDIEILLDELTN